ncbi:hypothetical protein [Marinicrinis lubricantis]|uniref:Uncharacterized protein n=1 Tax=Marinicrinis lubricantis TaxID=2086470 RepID=A0ABW1IJG1_9BACL
MRQLLISILLIITIVVICGSVLVGPESVQEIITDESKSMSQTIMEIDP